MKLDFLFKRSKLTGLIGVILISALVTFLFYGEIVKSPNTTYFALHGDGFKSSFGSYYHYKYDTSYMHTYSMNYPYGESIFFTGSQPIVVNSLKFLSGFGLDFSNNIIGILNIWMLLTVIIGVCFLYLLLVELGLPAVYSIVVSLIIAFISPHIERFSGHYNLAYLFVLPMHLYILLKYYKKPTIVIALISGFAAFISMYIHAYFYALYAVFTIFMLIALYFTERERFPALRSAFHLLLLVVLPILLFQLISDNSVGDRTKYPWGAMFTTAYIESVFLPHDSTYGRFLGIQNRVSYYVGLFPAIVFVILLVKYIRNFRRSENRFIFFPNKFLNALFAGAFVALIYSFMWPFKWKFEWPIQGDLSFLMNYMGPFRQFRASGRFSWLFFYTINLISFYYLWQWYKSNTTRFKSIVVAIVLLFGLYEAYDNARIHTRQYKNKLALLEDKNNALEANQWIKEIDLQNYQAILPLPYYHIGSETFWVTANEEQYLNAAVASWKTGLPLTSVMLSRTSISQTMSSLQLIFEPFEEHRIIDSFPNQKDLLVMENLNLPPSEAEQRLIEYSKPISKNNRFAYYALPLDSLEKLQEDFVEQFRYAVSTNTDTTRQFHTKPDTAEFIYYSFGNEFPELNRTENSLSFVARKSTTLIDTVLFDSWDTLLISVWVSGLDQDLLPRTRLRVRSYNNEGQLNRDRNKEIFRDVKYVSENGWGLMEFEYVPHVPGERLNLSASNSYTTGQEITFDDILIRQKNTNVFYRDAHLLYRNNRFVEERSDD